MEQYILETGSNEQCILETGSDGVMYPGNKNKSVFGLRFEENCELMDLQKIFTLDGESILFSRLLLKFLYPF